MPELWVTKDRRMAAAWIVVLEGHKDVVCPISLCQNDRLLLSVSTPGHPTFLIARDPVSMIRHLSGTDELRTSLAE
ncbi:hypothetical protein M405DRAFT_155638 [Rhizopogon salebrosus TDB-379]|nr:hypothetical protein M405DRAFT_155638 [Rhizopogon salebrosus TDB-379]